MTLQAEYEARYNKVLVTAAAKLETLIRGYLAGVSRIDRVVARAKSVDRFIKKAATVTDGASKYDDPLNQIQDQIGARVVTFYLSDVDAVEAKLRKYLNPIEIKSLVPDLESAFGYIGKHFIMLLPSDVSSVIEGAEGLLPDFFELQIKTLYQHAWAEAEHDLLYKPSFGFSPDQRRKVAFTAAQSWGADMIFEELHQATLVN